MIGEGRGTHGAVLGLERDGLLTITRPLVGSASAFRTVRVAHLTAQGHEVVPAAQPTSRPADPPNAARQQEAIRLLASAPDGIDSAELGRRGITPAMLKRLSELGLVTFTRRRVERDPAEHASAASDRPAVLELTAEQRDGVRPAHAPGAVRIVRDGPAARRDRQREDRAVSPAGA